MSDIIQGWDAIAKYFPYALSTVKQKHAPEMLKAGYVFRSNVDRPHMKKKPTVWTFKELILAYLNTLQVKNGKV